MDLADMDEADLGDCMMTGYAMLPVMDGLGVYSDCRTGCTYVKVVVGEASLSEQIQEILDFVYNAATDGALVGVKTPTSGKYPLEDWIARLQYARTCAEAGSLADTYVWLEDAYKLADGDIRPLDQVEGSATPQLAEDLKALLDELTPELKLEFETSNGNALVYSAPISLGDPRMGKALADEALTVAESALEFLAKHEVPNPWFFVADVLVIVSDLYDPVTVIPVGPNMDLTSHDKILATVSPATGNNDYSAIVVLDLLGTGWTEADAARVNSGLTLRAENRHGTEFYESIDLLSKEELKSLNPYRCYVIAPKSYFQATWSKPTYAFLNAFYQYGLGHDSDVEPILIQPK